MSNPDMANEIRTPPYTTGSHLYAVVAANDSRYANGTTLEAFNAAHWTSYAVTLTESGSTGRYFGNFPALPAGGYAVEVYERAGASPAISDPMVAGPNEMQWSGTAEITLASILGGTSGTGSTTVDHDYPTTANLSAEDGSGHGIDGVEVRAYLASEWAANPLTATVRGRTTTISSGAWSNTMSLDPGTYTFVYSRSGYQDTTKQQVVS